MTYRIACIRQGWTVRIGWKIEINRDPIYSHLSTQNLLVLQDRCKVGRITLLRVVPVYMDDARHPA